MEKKNEYVIDINVQWDETRKSSGRNAIHQRKARVKYLLELYDIDYRFILGSFYFETIPFYYIKIREAILSSKQPKKYIMGLVSEIKLNELCRKES